MSIEQQYFIQIISDYLNQKESKTIDNIDWNLIYGYGKSHNLNSIIYIQCKDLIPAKLVNNFLGQYSSSIVSSRNRNRLVNIIINELQTSSIRFLMVKGSEVSKLYYHPDLRTMGDTDFIVDKSDLERIDNILINRLGFDKSDDFNEWTYFKNGLEFEFHHSLVYDEDNHNFKQGQKILNNFYDYCINDENGFTHLTWNFHLVYLLFHLRKHIINEGVGLRQFLDIAFVCKRININWNFVETMLKQTGLLGFGKNVFTLIDIWFNVSTPLAKEDFDTSFYEEIIDKIFKDGVFGHGNDNNRTAQFLNVDKEKPATLSTRIKYVFKLIFPDVKSLKSMPYLKWINNHNILVPVAWIYRIFYLLFNPGKRKYFSEMMSVSKDELNKRKELIEKWNN